MMIETVDERLKDWVENVLDAVTVTLDPPGPPQAGRGVNLYLLELVESPPPSGTKRPPLQLSLRYLITTWADEPEEAHRLLGELVFAAMEVSEYEVELAPVLAATWMALGAIVQPSFMLRVPLRRERPEPEVDLVREPLVVQNVPISELRGTVLGPGDVPLMGALVELPLLQLRTRADSKGRFHFAAVPREFDTWRLRVKAKGREFQVTVRRGSEGEPLVIRVDPFD